jgi:hypothetical protein
MKLRTLNEFVQEVPGVSGYENLEILTRCHLSKERHQLSLPVRMDVTVRLIEE